MEHHLIEDNVQVSGEGKPGAPPYISYLTFKNFVEWLGTEGVPFRFDRSFWSKKYSGSIGPQLMAGLRFLGLLKGEEPTPLIERLVKAKGQERKEYLQSVYRDAYAVVNFEQLTRATPGMLRDWFGQYSSIDGATQRKAESFFINALKDADIPLSLGLTKMARNKPANASGQASATSGRRNNKQRKDPPTGSGRGNPGGDKPPEETPTDRADAQDSLMLWGLFKRLPKPGTAFPSHDRDSWIEAAKTLFNLEYKEDVNGR